MVIAVLVYLIALISAEGVLVHLNVLWGFLGHLFLIPALLIHYAMIKPSGNWRILPVLALIPLLRVFSLIVALEEIPVLYWHAMISVPLLISVFLAIRLLELSRADLGLSGASARAWAVQLLIALSGFPLSGIAYYLLEPDPLVESFNMVVVVIGAIILTISTGFIEEIIFRGLLQPFMNAIFGRPGYLLANGLFATLYLGWFSAEFMLFMGLTGLFFAWCVERTRLLWGVILAHSILTTGLLLVLPHV